MSKNSALEVANMEDLKNTKYRQKYHFMPARGWLNDPNGCIYFRGNHHLFYQYNPHSPHWAQMYWGHAVSRDLIHWSHLPVALTPESKWEDSPCGGCFSGTAIETDAQEMALVYTAVNDKNTPSAVQCLAISNDGLRFNKYERNPIISSYPHNVSSDVRDPKILSYGGKWYVVLGASLGVGAHSGGEGAALLYQSSDLRSWTYRGVMARSAGKFGTMWECPDLFQLGNKWVLMFSPMYCGEKVSVYWIGSMDFEKGIFLRENDDVLDWGGEYYAAQSYEDETGRRIIMAWQNGWDWMPWWRSFGPTAQEGWCGSMALPREMTLTEGGKVSVRPAEELKKLRGKPEKFNSCGIESAVIETAQKCLDCCEIELLVDLKRTTAKEFEIRFRCHGEYFTAISINLEEKLLKFDRSHADSGMSNKNRTCPLNIYGTELLLQIYCDTISVEIFINGGDCSMSNLIYPEKSDPVIMLQAANGVLHVAEMTVWPLENIW